MIIATPAADRKHYFDDFSIEDLAPTWGWPEEKVRDFLLEMQAADALFFAPKIDPLTHASTRLSALLIDAEVFVRFQIKAAVGGR